MAAIFSWIKKNKLIIFLLFIIFFLLLKNKPVWFQQEMVSNRYGARNLAVGGGEMAKMALPAPEFPPTTDVSQRLVIKNSSLSLVVKKVPVAQNDIIKKTESLGGYMVSSSLDNPQENTTATVVVRVPAEKLDEALSYFRRLAVKVISENLYGDDVTDQYVDIQTRMKDLEKTKAKFEEILEKAIQVSDIVEVQRELVNIQTQIDALKGQEKYLEESAKLAKITVYLSTDEMSLPYTPSESWRPKAIFKQAVRSLIGTLRLTGTVLIWIGVYSILLIPASLIIYLIYKFFKNKNESVSR